MRPKTVAHRVAVAVALTLCATAIGLRAAERAETLVYAVYEGQDTANQVFKTMTSAQYATGERIESYAVVSKDMKGKVRVHDQRSHDAAVCDSSACRTSASRNGKPQNVVSSNRGHLAACVNDGDVCDSAVRPLLTWSSSSRA